MQIDQEQTEGSQQAAAATDSPVGQVSVFPFFAFSHPFYETYHGPQVVLVVCTLLPDEE